LRWLTAFAIERDSDCQGGLARPENKYRKDNRLPHQRDREFKGFDELNGLERLPRVRAWTANTMVIGLVGLLWALVFVGGLLAAGYGFCLLQTCDEARMVIQNLEVLIEL
jgi:hypothetical protein